MIDIMVGLEKLYHMPKWDIPYVLGESRERCKREIKKNY